MKEENSEEVCGNEKLEIPDICIRSVNLFGRSLFDGVGRTHLRREPYWYCNRDRDSRNQYNHEGQEGRSMMDFLWFIRVGGIATTVMNRKMRDELDED